MPLGAWQNITMDFIEQLLKYDGKDTIWVIVDRYSKYNHFISLSHPFTVASLAQIFLDHIYKLHGLPQFIVSDRDKVFTIQFWKELFKSIAVQLCMSTTYHPQSDGQSEKVNQCLETYLRCMIGQCPKK